MHLVPFFAVDPDLSVRETRVITLLEPQRSIPPGVYGLVEFYCPDPACDCRRVMLNVSAEQHPLPFLASISYGFDRSGPQSGPFLDPLNEQCPYANALMEMVSELTLSDPAYLARLERHYHMVKKAASDPSHAVYQEMQNGIADELEAQSDAISFVGHDRNLRSLSPPPARRNDPCPCGSGKKFKYCCGRRQ